MSFQGFGKNSGPSAPPKAQTPFGNFPGPPSPAPPLTSSPLQRSPRPIESPPKWGDGQKSFFKDYNAQAHKRPPAVASFDAPRNSGAGVSAKIAQFQDPKRTRSPPLLSTDEDISRNSRTVIGSRSDLLINNHGLSVPQRTRSPPLVLESKHSVEDFGPFGEAQQSALSPPAWGNQPRLPGNFSNLPIRQDQSQFSPYVGIYDTGRNIPTKHADVEVSKRTRSPSLLSANEVSRENSHFTLNNSKRPSLSPPKLGTGSNVLFNAPNSQIHQRPLPPAQNVNREAAVTKPSNFQVPKRTRSPPLPSADQVFQGNSYSLQDDIERELQAKAKRLARFKVELSQPVQSAPVIGNQKFSSNRHDQAMVERRKITEEHSADMVGDLSNGSILSYHEAPESSSIITGLCPDMCPESERAERERKGDLDQYERLDGDRNQTSESLAVKKYTRTAEREADLIRPMPVLQNTIDYLLNLLDQPYDDRFLGLYNFLWDRMRAIRMDLRMQHIFNLGAITMLEQMIRLHIIAMHELCEHTKGEGFSEGFDAHLNIEQMNKTSVELFQLYDDHRKKGIKVPTEKEFRGYYALLKLDKHPGYKVEPAELSLDLSKMTPEMRQNPEVLFARDVARACRTGNFIAFFRLARKASYLQACLMHAHFAKLRTQALASLHFGLQNNQGVPVVHVAVWLGIEEEDIQSLLESHGFLIKEFEELYMVKEGPFLNGDNNYPVKCSKLVHLKKSRRIVEDVSSPCLAVSLPAEEVKEFQLGKVYEQEPTPVQFVETESSYQAVDEEMPDHEAVLSPKDTTQVKPTLKTLAVNQQSGDGHQVTSERPFSWDFSLVHNSPESQQPRIGSVGKPNYDTLFRNSLERNKHSDMDAMPSQIMSRRLDPERFPDSQIDSAMETLAPQTLLIKDLEDEQHKDLHQEIENDEVTRNYHDEEVAEAKLKLILRIWKRRSSKKRELREQRQLAANAALNSLSLGPPIRHNKDQPNAFGEFNIDHVLSERNKKHERSWSRLNVSDVVAGKLGERNPDAKCLCWKIILCSQMDNQDGEELGQWGQAAHLTPGPWLLSKIMPTRKDEDDDSVISFPGLSIWKEWIPSQSGGDLTCCLSVIKDTKLDNLDETVLGASAVLFLSSESISWELQKIRLHNLLMSLPSSSCLPLLIVSDSYEENSNSSSTIIEKLGLHDIENSWISTFLIIFLNTNKQLEHFDGFFSDEQLREGLQWLASESPSQPVLNCVKTRELVLNHLNSSLEVLDEMSVHEVGPNHCISAFNEALDRSLGEVAAAAEANPACWPCPEIALLEESSDEHRAVKLYLPNTGWSSASRIQPLICALRDSKLPTFPDDISWLYRGSNFGKSIENQKLQLENCLIGYLTESSKMMGLALATKEACVMLQKSAGLELHNSTYYIVPKWVMIFRRVFNWRLMSLSNGVFSTAYILEKHGVDIQTSGDLDKLELEGSISSPYYLIHPSLDEMVEVGCSHLTSGMGHSEQEAFQPPTAIVMNGNKVQEATSASDLMEDERNFARYGKLTETNDDNTCITNGLNNTSSGLVEVTKATREDKLSKLLEQCNVLQDMIDKKLSIYF
uniref:PCI domain-containing protein n=1 Tax=Davidia involucrata TaxID=16924 RepID=A0A5B6ZI47_DAVIN